MIQTPQKLRQISPARERLTRTALKLFSERGYQGTTTRELATEAGVSEVTLFRHFSSKEKLLQEVISQYAFIKKFKAMTPVLLERSYEEGLSVIANELLETLVELKDWIRILHSEVQHANDAMYQIYHSFLDDLFGSFASYFREMQIRGKMKPVDPEFTARVFHGIFFSFFNVEEILNRKNYKITDRVQATEEFLKVFMHGTVALS